MKKMMSAKNPKFYTITMPDGTRVKFWFSGKTFEEVLKAYNIPYKKTETYRGE